MHRIFSVDNVCAKTNVTIGWIQACYILFCKQSVNWVIEYHGFYTMYQFLLLSGYQSYPVWQCKVSFDWLPKCNMSGDWLTYPNIDNDTNVCKKFILKSISIGKKYTVYKAIIMQ